jgi:hypothetical protein
MRRGEDDVGQPGEARSGIDLIVTNGYLVMLEPLPPGEHLLEVGATIPYEPDPLSLEGRLQVEVVEPASQ